MNQQAINEQEWSDRANWRCFFYSSRKDSRYVVPKRWGWGWTFNFGRPGRVFWIIFGLLGALHVLATIGLTLFLTRL